MDMPFEEEPKPYNTEVNDLAFIIAQMTSGMKGALPEQDDFDIAKEAANICQALIDEFYDN